MNELLKVNEDSQTVSARDLYEAVGSTERFSTWFERQLQYGFKENEDYTGCKTFNTQAHQELQDIKTLVYQKGLDFIRKKYNERYYAEPVLTLGGYAE